MLIGRCKVASWTTAVHGQRVPGRKGASAVLAVLVRQKTASTERRERVSGVRPDTRRRRSPFLPPRLPPNPLVCLSSSFGRAAAPCSSARPSHPLRAPSSAPRPVSRATFFCVFRLLSFFYPDLLLSRRQAGSMRRSQDRRSLPASRCAQRRLP
jgi:hypothetical protein